MDFYKKYYVTKETSEFMEQYDRETENTTSDDSTNNNVESPLDSIESANLTSSGKTRKPQYKGFNVLGKIEIPKTNLQYPILESVTKKSIEKR